MRKPFFQLSPTYIKNQYDGEAGEGGGGGSADDPVALKNQVTELNKTIETLKKNHATTLDEMRALSTKSKLTEQERTELTGRIETTQNELLTEKERSEREKTAAEKKYKTDVDALTSDRDGWQKRYTDARIDTDLTAAAVEHKAFRSGQIVEALRSKTSVEPVLDDDGKPTGEYVTKVTVKSKAKDGSIQVLKVDPSEAVKRMKEDENYANFFISDASGGLGAKGSDKSKDIDPTKLSPAEYMKARREGKLSLNQI